MMFKMGNLLGKKRASIFPNWILWISIIFNSFIEFARALGLSLKDWFGFEIALVALSLSLLWWIPSKCVWHTIKNTQKDIKYKNRYLWILLVFYVLFKSDNLLSYFINSSLFFAQPVLILKVIAILTIILFWALTVLIPAYCIWLIIKINQKKRKEIR